MPTGARTVKYPQNQLIFPNVDINAGCLISNGIMYIEKISQVIPVPYNIFIFGYKLFNVTPACCAVNSALF